MKILNNKSIQTFLAIGPIVLFMLCLISYFVFFFSMFANIEQMQETNEPPVAFFGGMVVFIVAFFLAMAISFLSMIYFIIHAAKNPLLEEGSMRVVWILILVLVGGLGNFIYWLVEIRMKNPKPVIPN